MIIRNKIESLYYLEKLGVNYFPEEYFNPNDRNVLEKVNSFIIKNDVTKYVLRDYSKCQGKTFFNISKEEVYKNIQIYKEIFSIAVSSKNFGKYELIGDIYLSHTLKEFWILASDNSEYNTREVLKNPKWNYNTDYYDKRLRYIPNIDKIIDYIFKYNLFDVIIEFAVYPTLVGKNNEFVAIFELRTHY